MKQLVCVLVFFSLFAYGCGGEKPEAAYRRGYEAANLEWAKQLEMAKKSSYDKGFEDGRKKERDEAPRWDLNLRKVAYKELISFLAKEKTTIKRYGVNDFANRSADLFRNAIAEGILARMIVLEYTNRTGWFYTPTERHLLVAFITSDKGMVYVEPEDNTEIALEVGKDWYYPPPNLWGRPMITRIILF